MSRGGAEYIYWTLFDKRHTSTAPPSLIKTENQMSDIQPGKYQLINLGSPALAATFNGLGNVVAFYPFRKGQESQVVRSRESFPFV